jgi:hypothetical protein
VASGLVSGVRGGARRESRRSTILNYRAEAEGVTVENVIRKLIETVSTNV